MSKMTTAEVLGKYRRELIAEGFKGHEVESIVQDAAMTLHSNDGIGVKSDD